MNLNSINYESVDDKYDPGYFSQHENVIRDEHDNGDAENLHKAMLLQVYSALDEFDNTNGNALLNPYQDKLTLDTANGSMQIPLEIQKSAINQWSNLKKNNISQNDQNDQDNKENSYDMVDSLFQFLLCILIIFTLMYTLSLFRKGVIRF